MQFCELELTKFRQHASRTFHFPKGLSLIRGSNRIGKTSALEGLGYCLLGSGLLQDPMDRVITRGETTGMKTRLRFEVAGTFYICQRSPAGAELAIEGADKPLVTGQKEVTAKVEELLGIPHGRAAQTVFAGQNEVRGVLSVGPTATAQFIESLGNFDEIDNIITRLSGKLSTGPTKHLEDRAAQLQLRLEALADTQAGNPAPLRQTIETLATQATEAQAAKTAAETMLSDLETKNREASLSRQHLASEQAALLRAKSEHTVKRASCTAAIAAAEGASEALQALEEQAAQATSYSIYASMPRMPEEFWEGDTTSLEAEIQQLANKVLRLGQEVSGAETSIKEKLGQKILKTTCPTCGQNIADPAITAATNKRIDEEVSVLRQAKAKAEGERAAATLEAEGLLNVQRLGENAEGWLKNYEQFVTVDRNSVPPTITWKGPVPVQVAAPDAMEMARLRKTLEAKETAEKALAALGEFDDSRLLEVEAHLAVLGESVSTTDAAGTVAATRAIASRLEQQLNSARLALAEAEAAQKQADKEKAQLSADIAAATTEIKAIKEDNAVLDEAKKARKAVMDMIWNKIMGAVSGYFSQLRGEPAVVTREDDGFLVDGSKCRLSGAELDLLGLALRISVCKVFSSCSIMVLDEPSSACDAERTAQMIAVLGAAGFDQIIMVSHKDADENSGAYLIQL